MSKSKDNKSKTAAWLENVNTHSYYDYYDYNNNNNNIAT